MFDLKKVKDICDLVEVRGPKDALTDLQRLTITLFSSAALDRLQQKLNYGSLTLKNKIKDIEDLAIVRVANFLSTCRRMPCITITEQ